ncbi:helix-turn-helix transcriptional regulator [Myroides odoratus]|uniref:response regulator transcription factor n=1 Tax=Myroides odoratus TaxID=256 RepID=UPI00333F3765
MKYFKYFSPKLNGSETGRKNEEYEVGYLEVIKAFAVAKYESIYIIDCQKKSFEYVSENPLFLCGHTAEEVQEMGYDFYLNNITKSDLEVFETINTIGFEYYYRITNHHKTDYTISCDFHLKDQKGKTSLVHQKIIPIYFTSTGEIWKALGIVSLSCARKAGNITIYQKGGNTLFKYNRESGFWQKEERVNLSSREKEIIQLSARGYTVNEIAEILFISFDTVKFHKKKMFIKIGVTSISEAIIFALTHNLMD